MCQKYCLPQWRRSSSNLASHDLGSAPFTFFPGFSLPPLPFPSLLNNRKLSWAKCQWPGRLLPGTRSGAGAVVMAGGDAALSSRRRAPPSSRRSPQAREHPCRGARDAHLAVARLALGLSGVLLTASAAADLASRSEQMGLTLS